MKDGYNSAIRYYYNNFADGFRQVREGGRERERGRKRGRKGEREGGREGGGRKGGRGRGREGENNTCMYMYIYYDFCLLF